MTHLAKCYLGVGLFLAALAVAPSAQATASFSGTVSPDGLCDANVDFHNFDFEANPDACYRRALKIQATKSLPSNGRDCAANGLLVVGDSVGEPQPTVASVNPPFSGSASDSGYLTICDMRNNDYVVWQMGINLTKCALWICNTSYWYREVHTAREMHYFPFYHSLFDSALWVRFTTANGQTCLTLADCPISGVIY